jgi:hypothetical protein
MKRFISVAFGVLALLALPALASAQATHSDANHKADFHLSVAVVVGDKTIEPGDYRFECKMIGSEHVIVVKDADSGDELARVPCKPVTLDQKVDVSQYRTVNRNGSNVLTDVRIKGETIAHTVVS